MNITIRRVNVDEVVALQNIARATFAEAFSAQNFAASLEKYLTEKLSVKQIQKELQVQDSAYYFAVQGGTIVGYLKLNQGAAQTEDGLENALEIERIYTLISTHGKGVGQALYAKAMEVAQGGGFKWLWLGVWEENPRAIRFYEKNGFTPFGTHPFFFGGDAQNDLLMRKPIEN